MLRVTPIAVVPFVGSAPEDISKIVADDLRNSGKFNPIAVSQMPQHPTSAAGNVILKLGRILELMQL